MPLGNLGEAQLEEAQRQYLRVMPEVLGKMASVHVDDSGRRMVLLDYDPSTYPGQDLTNPVVLGQYPESQEIIDNAAVIAQPNFEDVKDRLEVYLGTRETIGSAGEHLAAGGNVAVVTRHDNLTDIAYALKMVSDLLLNQGYWPREQSIVVSEMLPRIGHNFKHEGGVVPKVPAMLTLQFLCSRIYKSYPRTKSTETEISKLEKADLVWAAIGQHNKDMVAALNEELDKGGVLLGLAPTGTTKVKEKVTGGLELSPLNDGTVEIMSHPRMKILGMLIEYGGSNPFAYLYPDLASIKGPDDANAAMEILASADTRSARDDKDMDLLRQFGGRLLATE